MADPDRLRHAPTPLGSEVSKTGDILSISGPERDEGPRSSSTINKSFGVFRPEAAHVCVKTRLFGEP
ncbi:hypothetical protein [Bradyrhizobium nanningense]|uniref:hypothetical protein n=1 Tax=Bradyrhizobium nanningense TaxID=1325118 RepID=UPI001008E5B5|nr:hypothetical protein [Bradyrhizobium nanningense]